MAHTCIPSSVTEMGIAVSSVPGEILYSDALSVATMTLEEKYVLVGLMGVTY